MSGRSALRELTLMVADDEERVNDFLRRALCKRGFSVLGARSGPEALLVAARHAGGIHLLIADAALPGSPGAVGLAQALRAHRPGLRVLYLSRRDPGEAVRDEVSRGAAEHLPKPLAQAPFLRAVLRALGPEGPRRVSDAAKSRNRRSLLLLVPDAEMRLQAARLLRGEGWRVLEAANIGEALRVSQWHAGPISLLLADAEVMARLPGELPERLTQSRPRMRILSAAACGLTALPLAERLRLTLEQWGLGQG